MEFARAGSIIACCPAPDHRPPATKALHTICGNNTTLVSSSWWWPCKCPKHFEQIISAIQHAVAYSWFYSLRLTTSVFWIGGSIGLGASVDIMESRETFDRTVLSLISCSCATRNVRREILLDVQFLYGRLYETNWVPLNKLDAGSQKINGSALQYGKLPVTGNRQLP